MIILLNITLQYGLPGVTSETTMAAIVFNGVLSDIHTASQRCQGVSSIQDMNYIPIFELYPQVSQGLPVDSNPSVLCERYYPNQLTVECYNNSGCGKSHSLCSRYSSRDHTPVWDVFSLFLSIVSYSYAARTPFFDILTLDFELLTCIRQDHHCNMTCLGGGRWGRAHGSNPG